MVKGWWRKCGCEHTTSTDAYTDIYIHTYERYIHIYVYIYVYIYVRTHSCALVRVEERERREREVLAKLCMKGKAEDKAGKNLLTIRCLLSIDSTFCQKLNYWNLA